MLIWHENNEGTATQILCVELRCLGTAYGHNKALLPTRGVQVFVCINRECLIVLIIGSASSPRGRAPAVMHTSDFNVVAIVVV